MLVGREDFDQAGYGASGAEHTPSPRQAQRADYVGPAAIPSKRCLLDPQQPFSPPSSPA